MKFTNSILFRIAAPVLLVLLIVLPALYLTMYEYFSDLAFEQARQELVWLGRQAYDIASEKFDDLMKEGLAGDEKAIRVKKGLAIGLLDEFFKRHNLLGVVHGEGKKTLLLTGVSEERFNALHDILHENDRGLPQEGLTVSGEQYLSYTIVFGPWFWDIYLFKDSAGYDAAIWQIRRLFLIFASILAAGLVSLLCYLVYIADRVKKGIVEPVKSASMPNYRGISEFEFLSESIREMMKVLGEKNRWISNLISSAGTVIIVTNREGKVVLFNRTGQELTGFSQDEVLGGVLWEIMVSEEDAGEVKNNHQNLFSQGKSISFRTHILRKDRKRISMMLNNTVIFDADSDESFAIYAGIDMSDLEKAEKELLMRSRQQAIISDLSQLALAGARLQVVMDESVVLVARNLEAEFCKILELEPGGSKLSLRSGVGWRKGLVGTATVGIGVESQAGLTLQSDMPVVVKDLRTESRFSGPALLTDHGIISGVSVVIHGADGPFGVLGVHTVKRRSFSDQDIHFLKAVAAVIAEAITRRKAEEALRESEEKYRLLVENANEAIFVAQDNLIKFPNPVTLELIGYTEEELLTKPFVELIHPEDRDLVIERYAGRLGGAEVPSAYSFRIISKKGKTLWGMINSVLIDWEGRPATLNFLQDITEQKELEAQVLQAQKMESIGTLAGGIAHDFNNLLGGILGYASLMKMKIGEGDELYKPVAMIEKSATRAAELTSQLLGFARSGKYDERLVDFNMLVEETLGILDRTLDKGIEIKKRLEITLPPVKGDPGQLQQILMNLCINAADAMPEGGQLMLETFVENVTEKLAHARLEVKPGLYVILLVADSGVGMDQETVKRIFDPFFTTKEVGKGTGLGLSMVYGVVKNHGGTVNVYSEKGQGTTFRVYLPVGGGEKQEAKKDSLQPYGGNENILVVDDEEQIRTMAKDMLEGFGYSVMVAETGPEAVEIFGEHRDKIDMILLDMVMPRMSGEKTFRELRNIDPEIKTLLTSGFSQSGRASEILKEGANGFIQKPYQVSELVLKVRSILDSA